MTNFKFKGFDVDINRPSGMRMYWTWDAYNEKTGDSLGDREGGDLGSVSNAKFTIKSWILQYLKDKKAFGSRHPNLVN